MTKSNIVIYPARYVTVYLHTTSASYDGPYSWCARIIDGDSITELGGASLHEHDTRLTIVGMINAFNSIKEPSIIKFICSNHEYAVKYVLERLDKARETDLVKRKAKNLDLFPSLRRAVKWHISIEGQSVGRSERDTEHLLAVEGAKRFLAGLQDREEPMSLGPLATVVLPNNAAVPW